MLPGHRGTSGRRFGLYFNERHQHHRRPAIPLAGAISFRQTTGGRRRAFRLAHRFRRPVGWAL